MQHNMTLLRLDSIAGDPAVSVRCLLRALVNVLATFAAGSTVRLPLAAGLGGTCRIARQHTELVPMTCRDTQATGKRSSLDEIAARMLSGSSQTRLTRSESSAPGALRLSPIGGETRAAGTFMPLRDAIMLVSSDGTQTGQLG